MLFEKSFAVSLFNTDQESGHYDMDVMLILFLFNDALK